ncbi:zinc finger matrin-type protein CG9776 [Microplitis demolitor]|uniref:zinc finger matrin-type protein CG9776 n=1 Tax=Microplitis demolitor TaxID=69319 RepID=UPI0004CDC38D|nr:zinc finger matrin-type protein CG9776 [Microplitis demolitor]XP_053594376.1 zinc finger matrin-type protein CG9776 [Microplitis demolitor]
METESRRKGPRSPSADSDESSHRRRARKYDRDRSPSPRRSRYRRSRSRDRRSGSHERRRKDPARNSQDWNKSGAQNQTPAPAAGYAPPVHNQYQAPPPPPNTSQPPPPMPPYNQGYNYNYNYNQGYEYGYPPPAGYRSDYPPPNWQAGQVPYNNQPAPAPPAMPPAIDPPRPVEAAPPVIGAVSRPEDSKKEAIAAEKKQQQVTLLKQREEYVRKTTTLQRELEILRQQCNEIGKEDGRENRIVKENQKLQVEIQNKMKSINNVIDMLTGIIGDKATVEDLKVKYKSESPVKRGKSPKEDFPKAKLVESPSKSSSSDGDREAKAERERKLRLNEEDSKPVYNFVHYDPEMHWCKVCDIFPKTAKEYLNHLHSNEHKETCLERKIVDMPWHKRNGEGTEKEVPYYPGLPTKRTPIKGLQFFSPATAWYCRLCDSWIGDLHCASLHLKSKRHSENFSNYVDQNPHWETDWMADREKAFSDERQKQMQLELQKQKEDEPPAKVKKSKKSKKNKKKSKKRKNKSSNSESSSDSENSDSESDQDTSKSIRVAMRNKMKASTQAILNEEIDYHGIKLKGHWSHVAGGKDAPQENDDRQLLNSIRDKLKAKQEEEMKRRGSDVPVTEQQEGNGFADKSEANLEAWGPKEPPKSFWIKKDDEKSGQPQSQQQQSKQVDIPKPDEMPKPHMGFWTKQQVNMTIKPQDKSSSDREEDRERDRDRKYDHKEDRDRKYDRRDDKYHGRYDSYDRRGRGGRDRDRDRERDRDRDRDYYDDRRKDRRGDDSPRRWRDSPKRSYDKYKDRRDDDSNDEKYDKKNADAKKKQTQVKKQPTPSAGKGKLPFIGRLPLFKKKEDNKPEKDITPLPYTQSKFEDTPKVPNEIINPPGVVHITKLAGPIIANNVTVAKPAMKILVAPPPPVLNAPKTSVPPQVVDMEIEDQSEETIIEDPTAEASKTSAPKPTPASSTTGATAYTQPPPFIASNPPPYVQAQQFPVRPQVMPTTMPTYAHPPPMQTAYVAAPQAPMPMMPMEPHMVEGAAIEAEPDKRAEGPLPEDLQEALNIIFPKDEPEAKKDVQMDNHIMYASMYSSMIGCVGYGPEYMDQPPPEITQADTETETQPGPDDLKMLGIDEGDTIF